MAKSAIIIGSGIGGLGAAALLSKAGYRVTVLEKNPQTGGRAGLFTVAQDSDGTWRELPGSGTGKTSAGISAATAESQQATESAIGDEMQGDGAERTEADQRLHRRSTTAGDAADHVENTFRFDMGPSWYLMPDVFDHFFSLLGEEVEDHLDLVKLSPSYRIFYKDTFRKVDLYSNLNIDGPTVEQIEPGASRALKRYLDQAEYQYGVAKDRFMYKNYDSIRDFFTREMMLEGRKLSALSTMDRYVGRYFQTDAMRKIMQYPLVFLGSSPYNTPAIYNIMSHIDFNLGVYYPQGGIYEIVKALQGIAEKRGAVFRTNSPVAKICVEDGEACGVMLQSGEELRADIIVSDADIHHTEQDLLAPEYRTKSKRYWKSRTLAPSALIMYLGVKGSLPQLTHHNLLFSKDWRQNFGEIFDKPQWPTDPSLYICNPSKTDPTVAPEGHENLFVLVPIAPGLEYTDATLDMYADRILETIEKEMRIPRLRKNIVYRRLFSVEDFEERYNSYRGSALGLAHTLRQTAIFRPNNVSSKVSNLYYVGANTNPGIGMPSCLISAELMFKRLINDGTSGPLEERQLHL